MENNQKAEMLTELYLKEHSFHDLTPSEFADKYQEIYDEILNHLQNNSSSKKQKAFY